MSSSTTPLPTPAPAPTPPAGETVSESRGFTTDMQDWWNRNVRTRYGNFTEDTANEIANTKFGLQQKLSANTIKALLPVAIGGGIALGGLLLLEPIQKISKYGLGFIKWGITGGGTERKKGWFEKIPAVGGAFTALGSALDFIGEGLGYAIPAIAGFVGYQMLYTPPNNSNNYTRTPAALTSLHGTGATVHPPQYVAGPPRIATPNAPTIEIPIAPAARPSGESTALADGTRPSTSEIQRRINDSLSRNIADPNLTQFLNRRFSEYEDFRAWIRAGACYNEGTHNLERPSDPSQDITRTATGRPEYIRDMEAAGLSHNQALAMIPSAPIQGIQEHISNRLSVASNMSTELTRFAHDFLQLYGKGLDQVAVRNFDGTYKSGDGSPLPAHLQGNITVFEIGEGTNRRLITNSTQFTNLSNTEQLEFLKKALHFTHSRYNQYFDMTPNVDSPYMRSSRVTVNFPNGYAPECGATLANEMTFLNRYMNAGLFTDPIFGHTNMQGQLRHTESDIETHPRYGFNAYERDVHRHVLDIRALQESGLVEKFQQSIAQMRTRMRNFGESHMAVVGYYNPPIEGRNNPTGYLTDTNNLPWHYVQVADRRNSSDPRDYTLCYEFKDGNYVLHSFRQGMFTNAAEFPVYNALPWHNVTGGPSLSREGFQELINGGGIAQAMTALPQLSLPSPPSLGVLTGHPAISPILNQQVHNAREHNLTDFATLMQARYPGRFKVTPAATGQPDDLAFGLMTVPQKKAFLEQATAFAGRRYIELWNASADNIQPATLAANNNMQYPGPLIRHGMQANNIGRDVASFHRNLTFANEADYAEFQFLSQLNGDRNFTFSATDRRVNFAANTNVGSGLDGLRGRFTEFEEAVNAYRAPAPSPTPTPIPGRTSAAPAPADTPLAEPLPVMAAVEQKPLVIGFMDNGELPGSQSTPSLPRNNQRMDLSQIRPMGTA